MRKLPPNLRAAAIKVIENTNALHIVENYNGVEAYKKYASERYNGSGVVSDLTIMKTFANAPLGAMMDIDDNEMLTLVDLARNGDIATNLKNIDEILAK